jgi:chromosomal replication initiation ATPase DnaA
MLHKKDGRTSPNAMCVESTANVETKAEVVSAGKRRSVVKARSIVSYWAHRKPGINQTELARKFGLSQPAVCAAVRKGQKIVQELQFELAKNKL